ncbi:hypothetical protein ACLOJK_031388 [Asimina triloba]
MGYVIVFFFLLFSLPMFHVLSDSHISVGNQIIVSIPSRYDPTFHGKAFFMQNGELVPNFKAALSVDAVGGRYLCELAVFLGDVKVWNSGRFSRFYAAGSCILQLLETGLLQLSDSDGRVGWRIGAYGQGIKRLELKRTGNLILMDSENHTKWQSFDFPTDIMLWHQRLYAPAGLTSFINNSTLFYSFEIQHKQIALYLYSNDRSYSYWEFKPSKNRSIAFAELGSNGLKLFNSKYHKVAQIPSKGEEPIRFAALSRSGSLGFYHYSPHAGKFEASFQVINSTCDLPLPCGPCGICIPSNPSECMQALRCPGSIQSKCDKALSSGFCHSRDATKMVEMQGISTVLRGMPLKVNVNKEECASLCEKDCTCLAVLFSNKGNQQGCSLYELVGGVRQFQLGAGESYLVKFPEETGGSCGSTFGIKKLLLVIGGVVDGVAIMLILGGLILYLVKKKRQKDNRNENT